MENFDTPPNPLIHKLFRYRKFSETEHRRVHLRNFKAQWDEKLSTENRDTPSPLLPVFPWTFPLPEIFWNTAQKSSSTKCFGTARQKIFDGKPYSPPPPPPLSLDFFATGFFLIRSTESCPCEIFRHCETKNFRRRILILPLLSPHLLSKLFRHPKLMKNWKIPLRKFSAVWDNFFRRKIVILPPPSSPFFHELFRYRKFSETQHKRVPLRNVSVLRDKRFSPENLILRPPPPLSIDFFATGLFLKRSTESCPCEIFRHCETKNFRRRILILPLLSPHLLSKLFRHPKLMKHWKIPLRKFSALWDNFFRRKILIFPPILLPSFP